MINRYDGKLVHMEDGGYVTYSEYEALQQQVHKMVAENLSIKSAFKSVHNSTEEAELYGDVKYMVEASEYEALVDAVEETPNTDAVIREIGAKAVDDSDDKKRMDWLCAHCVEVRSPQMYGSHAMFHAQQDSEEWDLPHHTTLREQVDAAIRAGDQP